VATALCYSATCSLLIVVVFFTLAYAGLSCYHDNVIMLS
jgi:hypothetical protein